MAETNETAEALLAALRAKADDEGFFEALDADHEVFHIVRGDSLLVTFETGPVLWGPSVAEDLGLSVLTVRAATPSWYRRDVLYDFFDNLTDDAFFDDFEKVLFAGGVMGSYGAAAYCVAHPGADVLLIQPVATLEPARVPWEARQRAARAYQWGPRYSYGPDNVIGSDRVTVINDPTSSLDAMHASLYAGAHITHLPAPHGGPDLLAVLWSLKLLTPIVEAALNDKLDQSVWGPMWRKRRRSGPYLKTLLKKLDGADRPYLVSLLCAHVTNRIKAPAFERHLKAANASLRAEGITPPADRDL